MEVGSYYYKIANTKVGALIMRFTGVMEYHTHIRIKPLLKYMKTYWGGGNRNILEIGCGTGTNLFEIKLRQKNIQAIGLDMNQTAIETANKMKKLLKLDRIDFVCIEAFQFLNQNLKSTKKVDTVLLYDFLEHIEEPKKFIEELIKRLPNDVEFIVSVPTKRYKKVFGAEFHESVGHVIDGYTKEMIDKLFRNIGYKCVVYEYNTGLVGNIGAWLYYNKFGSCESRVGKVLKYILTIPFRYFDLNGKKLSSEIFAVYGKSKGKENKMAIIRKKIKPVYIIIFCSFFMIFILNCLHLTYQMTLVIF